MDENEWQPVRIAPAPKVSPCGGPSDEDEHFLLMWRRHQGKIVRVKKVPISWLIETDPNDTMAFEVHPHDCAIIEFTYGDHLCEHQILAD